MAKRPASTSDTVPVGPTLSMFDPVYLGIDEAGTPMYLPMMYNNLLVGGVPGSGKSVTLSLIVAHAALSADCRLCLIDGKQVELGLWRECADVFVGPDIDHAITTLRRLQTVMDNRYTYLTHHQCRKVERGDGMTAILLCLDEIAYFSATIGDKTQRDTFSALLRDIVARGRAVAIMVVGATQRPTADIIPTSLREIFSWRLAARCTTDVSSDVILGHGWAGKGYSAATIHPNDQGVAWLAADNGIPRRIKTAYLDDEDIIRLAAYARDIRRHSLLKADSTETAPATPSDEDQAA
jgi:S-DNA-T family DNA segregation ATPase FtsK/SpoIIIE